MICAMPNTVPAFTDWDTYRLTMEQAQAKAVCDYGLIIGGANSNTKTSVGVTAAVAKKLYLNHTHNPSNALALGKDYECKTRRVFNSTFTC